MNSLPTDDAERGKYPMADGLLDYFPNALAEVSRISYEGNQKHNPGEQMHWARGKSTDHRNKVIRHTVDSVQENEDGIEHAAQAAWRALAYLQEKIELVRSVPLPAAAKLVEPKNDGCIVLRRKAGSYPHLTQGKDYLARPLASDRSWWAVRDDLGKEYRVSDLFFTGDSTFWEKVNG